MSFSSSVNPEKAYSSTPITEEIIKKIQFIDIKLQEIRKNYDADELQVAEKKKQLAKVKAFYDSLQNRQRKLTTLNEKEQQRWDEANNSTTSFSSDRDDEESLAIMRDSVRALREENERLGAQVVRNDQLLRFGPNMGTLALRTKRTTDSRKYADLQRGVADARHEVSALDFHLRNEEAKLVQTRRNLDKLGVIPEQPKTGFYCPTKQVSALKDKLKNSKFRIGEFVQQKTKLVEQEKKLDNKIKELEEQLNAYQQY